MNRRNNRGLFCVLSLCDSIRRSCASSSRSWTSTTQLRSTIETAARSDYSGRWKLVSNWHRQLFIFTADVKFCLTCGMQKPIVISSRSICQLLVSTNCFGNSFCISVWVCATEATSRNNSNELLVYCEDVWRTVSMSPLRSWESETSIGAPRTWSAVCRFHFVARPQHIKVLNCAPKVKKRLRVILVFNQPFENCSVCH